MTRRAWERRLAVRLVRCEVPRTDAQMLLRQAGRVGRVMSRLVLSRPPVPGKVVRR